jgi:DNA-binding NtrC family response regulator
VRELENAIERAVVLSRGNVITADHLPFGDVIEANDRARLSRNRRKAASSNGSLAGSPEPERQPVAAGRRGGGEGAEGAETAENGEGGAANGSFKAAVADLEKRLILDALERAGGNRSKAAEELGIYRRLLYAKLREYGLGE